MQSIYGRARTALVSSASALALLATGPAFAQDAAQEDDGDSGVIVITAQRQAQSLQDVPIAVSAFTADALEKQQIENSSDLQLTLPNVTFTKTNFTSSSFTIRGIGDLCTGVTCDQATAIHVNGAPLFGTRLFETEFFDLERIEVLRGPQGTLFGRNATAGVVNVITAKPDLDEFGAAGEAEYGNFKSFKVKGMVNLPVTETLGVRVAGFYLNRDGFTQNLYNNTTIDGRKMFAVRGSVRWEPTPDTTLDLMAYYFREKDDRLRIQKQMCQRDPTGVLGCLPGRREFGTVNGNATFPSILGSREFLRIRRIPTAFGLGSIYGTDIYANFVNPADVRQVRTDFTPEYFTSEQQYQARLEHNFENFSVSLAGTYQKTKVDSRQDYNLSVQNAANYIPALTALAGAARGAIPGLPANYFSPITRAITPSGPAGPYCTSNTDPTGTGSYGGNKICGKTPLDFDRSVQEGSAWSIEAIVTSDLDSPLNFLLGGIYAQRHITENSYYVNAFGIDYVAGVLGAFSSFPARRPPSYLGSPFFRNNTDDFKLKSFGIFGEAYYEVSDAVKLTLGIRYNNDRKVNRARSTLASFLVPHGSKNIFSSPFVVTYDADPGKAGNQLFQERSVSFSEWTGRAVIDWQASDDTLIYASVSRGYKSGGINPPLQPIFAVPDSFTPEKITAFEVGAKNTLFDGAMQLNLTAFYYKYKQLQLSRIVARTSVNDNVDANIFGLEAEAVISPSSQWQINVGASYLHTKVSSDKFLSNPRDPSAGRSDAVIIKDLSNASNCAVIPTAAGNAAATNAFVGAINTNGFGLRAPTAFPTGSGINGATGAFSFCQALKAAAAGNIGAFNPALAPLQALLNATFNGGRAGPLPFTVAPSGVTVNIRGNKLPQAPNFKFSLGTQYTIEFDNGMSLIPRADLAFTGESSGTIFNGNADKLGSYTQVNAQIQLNGVDDRWFVRGYVQNLFNTSPVTGLYVTDASSGLFTNVFSLDPRRYGIAAGFRF